MPNKLFFAGVSSFKQKLSLLVFSLLDAVVTFRLVSVLQDLGVSVEVDHLKLFFNHPITIQWESLDAVTIAYYCITLKPELLQTKLNIFSVVRWLNMTIRQLGLWEGVLA